MYKKVIKVLGVMVLSLFCVNGALEAMGREKEKKKPNILFILSDDHTSQAWGVYGGLLKDYVTSPNISRLADEGIVLDNCFCTNSICTPSRAAILTGKHSHKNKVYNLSHNLDRQQQNVAKILQKDGYQTAVIGKWHLYTKPSGFDYFNVLPGQGRYHNPLLKSEEGWVDGHDGGIEYKGFSTDVITEQSIKWMKNRDKDRPFMMMCHFKATHEPFDYPERYKDLYKDIEIPEVESLFEFDNAESGRTINGQTLEELAKRYTKNKQAYYPDMPFSVEGLDSVQLRKKVYQKLVKDFMRSGAAIDDNIGKLLEFLDEEGLAENTIVIYTADQGYYLGEHGFFDKRLMYEESLRMPFVIRYPGEIPAKKRNDDLIQNIDFAPTLLDYAGIDTPPDMQGMSFRNNLTGNTSKDWRNAIYYRYWMHQTNRPAHFGIRNHRYKLIFFYGSPLDFKKVSKKSTTPSWEFYDLMNDPREMYNAYNNPEYAKIIASMKDELLKLRKDIGDTDEEWPQMQEIIDKHWNK
ncbi:sulfatase family protein [Carboxylicivirga sp. RSCT41]|uniref:sulfatase family protein n=1 Tax=Carboxylicivirga agarovorans TaxID=3417570 RepID=UPI003D32FF02